MFELLIALSAIVVAATLWEMDSRKRAALIKSSGSLAMEGAATTVLAPFKIGKRLGNGLSSESAVAIDNLETFTTSRYADFGGSGLKKAENTTDKLEKFIFDPSETKPKTSSGYGIHI